MNQLQHPDAGVFSPETPFLDPSEVARVPQPVAVPEVTRAGFQLESPFVASWGEGTGQVLGPKALAFSEFMAEAYDAEFEAAFEDVVNEATALVADRFGHEVGDPVQLQAEAEAAVRDYLRPLERELEAMFDRAIAAAGDRDVTALTEAEIDAFTAPLADRQQLPSPVFEHFLKKFRKKVGKFVKAAAKVAKKVAKFTPAALVLGQLKKIAEPLLKKLLSSAIHKVPEELRPVAGQLAKKMLGIDVAVADAPPSGDADAQGPAAAPAAAAVEDVDATAAATAVEGEAFLHELETFEFAEHQVAPRGDPLLRLDQARARFAKRIVSLKPGEAAEPEFEEFIPAVMAAAKLGIKLVGRPRVVSLLAGLMAKLMKGFIGEQNARALAQPLAGATLSMVGLEAPEASGENVGYALASTVEETIQRLAEAPPTVWRNDTLMEAYVTSAFERAATAALPDEVVREPARETAARPGAWVPMPEGPQKRYQKYGAVLDVTLTPQIANAIPSFGGTPLSVVLRDRAGIKVDRTLRARLHLYQAISGTTLSRITFHEKKVRGLGNASRSAWSLVFPLTRAAASALTGEPGLGADVAARWLQDPNLIRPGQRFGYLEFGRDALVAPRPEAREPSHVGVLLDVPGGRVVVRFYYSDADAAQVVQHLKGGAPASAVIRALVSGRDTQLRAIFAGGRSPRLRISDEGTPIQAQIPEPVFEAFAGIGEAIVSNLIDWVMQALLAELEKGLKRTGDEFIRAHDAPEDGVTVAFVFRAPKLLELVHALITRGPIATGMTSVRALAGAVLDMQVEVRPGNVW